MAARFARGGRRVNADAGAPRLAIPCAVRSRLLVAPVPDPLWVWLLHGEAPRRALAGGLVILVATAAQALADARARSAADRAIPVPPC